MGGGDALSRAGVQSAMILRTWVTCVAAENCVGADMMTGMEGSSCEWGCVGVRNNFAEVDGEIILRAPPSHACTMEGP